MDYKVLTSVINVSINAVLLVITKQDTTITTCHLSIQIMLNTVGFKFELSCILTLAAM